MDPLRADPAMTSLASAITVSAFAAVGILLGSKLRNGERKTKRSSDHSKPPSSSPASSPAESSSNSAERKIATVCVFCGSKDGKKPIYVEAAKAFGDEMARRGLDLVCVFRAQKPAEIRAHTVLAHTGMVEETSA